MDEIRTTILRRHFPASPNGAARKKDTTSQHLTPRYLSHGP